MQRRTAVKTLIGGAALCLPSIGRAQARPNNSDDLIWQTEAANAADTSAYNRRTAKRPKHRALCLTEAGVAKALMWAQTHDLPFSIQSGGHCFEGFSQSDDLIIDLRRLNHADMTSGSTLSIGPGATLGDANLATTPTDQVLPAGYCQNVGIGGHIGGGGLGVLSRQFGLACDHLTAARVLLADGRFVTASAASHPDLFWALRGGGSGSFGIVTTSSFALQHVPTATFSENFWIIENAQAAQFISDWQAICFGFDRNITVYLYVTNHRPGHTRLRARLISTAPDNVTQTAMEKLNSLAYSLTDPFTEQGDFGTIAEIVWPRALNPRENTKVASHYLGAPAKASLWDKVVTVMDTYGDHNISMSLEVLGGAIDDLDATETAYYHRQGPRFLAQIGVELTPEDPPEEKIAALRNVQAQVAAAAVPGAYINYPDRDLADWQTQYWGLNYTELQRIKNQYDPTDVFRHPQSVRPG